LLREYGWHGQKKNQSHLARQIQNGAHCALRS
jgi:hypothetical protein